MVVSLLTHDFSVLYVAENNATTTPPFISAISLWAALEGSILFWALLATGWASPRPVAPPRPASVADALGRRDARIGQPVLLRGHDLAGESVRAHHAGAAEGIGPNALLQNHPFMALHPPLLYLGYTGLAVPFAFGVAALVTRRLDEEWLRVVRRWTLVPWTFLTLGHRGRGVVELRGARLGRLLGLGPGRERGAAAWLTATAFVHSAMVAERRGGLRIWTVALVIATFVLTLVGTFLTRSGVVASVHSFTQSAIGPWFLGGIVVALTAGSGCWCGACRSSAAVAGPRAR